MAAVKSKRVVRGRILIPPLPAAQKATVVLQVEDVSRADAPSPIVGEQRLLGVSVTPGGRVSFQVQVADEAVQAGHSYSLRAYIHLGSSGHLERGDLMSMQSYPVFSGGAPEEIEIEVKRVG